MCTFDGKKKVKITKDVGNSVRTPMMKQRCFIKNTHWRRGRVVRREKKRKRKRERRTARFIERERERTHRIGLFLFSSFV